MNDKSLETRASIGDAAGPPARNTARAKLQSCGDIANELARLYRSAKGGSIDVGDASKLANILSILSRIVSDSELEARIEALEQRGLH